MDTFIYLDQNTISDLRDRKLKEINDRSLNTLKRVLLAPNIQVLYSHVHLTEINQIPIETYQIEHIDLLEQLDAKYIDPLTKAIDVRVPHQVWEGHLENEVQNREIGITEVMRVGELSSRKLSGLPIEDSFEDIWKNLRSSLKTLLDGCTAQLESVNFEELEEPLRSHFVSMKEQLPELMAKSQSLETLSVPDSQELGPMPFRKCSEIQKLNIMQLPSNEVVHSIEKVFNYENNKFDWRDYFEDTPENRISRAYSLMNWAGYYADDFNKVKKRKDRFRASNNDMQHAMMGFGATFLISNDNAFRMKAMACYEYVGAKTIVCSLQVFLQNHYKFV